MGPDHGEVVTEYYGSSARSVTQCNPDGSLRISQTFATLPYSTGSREELISETKPAASPNKFSTLDITYGDNPPTDGFTARMSGPRAHAANADDTCTNSEYTLSGPKWSGYGYAYYANLSQMPHGDADRVEVTNGHHSWDYTTNDCGYNDITNFVSDYIGTTTLTPHTQPDGTNVVDFGDLTSLGVTSTNAIAITKTWYNGSTYTEADQRFEQPPVVSNGTAVWTTNGAVAGAFDVWNEAAHEAGHALGLGHALSSQYWLTMSTLAYTNSIRLRTLGKGDVLGLRAIYP